MILNDVRKNKTKTVFIVTIFFLVVLAFIYFLSLLIFDGDVYTALIIAFFFSSISSFISYYESDKIVLSINGCREANDSENKELKDILESLCLGCGIPVPKLYIMDDNSINAFATGRNKEHAVICVTTGLLKKLDKYEIQGVIGHELSHIRNYDILLSTVASVMVGMVLILARLFTRGFGRRNSDSDNKGNGILVLIGLIFVILSPIATQLLQLAISRNREYLADAGSVEITRNKEGLISALKKISEDNTPISNYNKATASLFISDPLKQEKDNLLSTHPSTYNRIKRLESIN